MCVMASVGLFSGLDGTAGAFTGASAAIETHVGVDFVDVAFADSACGADGLACSTSDAAVSNYVSHS